MPPSLTSSDDLRSHYAAVHDRIWNRPAVPEPAPAPPPRRDPPPIPIPIPIPTAAERAAAAARDAIRGEINRWSHDPLFDTVAAQTRAARERKAKIRAIAEAHGITYEEIVGERRTRPIIIARYAAIAAIYVAYPEMSLPAIGRTFGKDHTTILHAVRKMGVWRGPAERAAADAAIAAAA